MEVSGRDRIHNMDAYLSSCGAGRSSALIIPLGKTFFSLLETLAIKLPPIS
jgi:hypothetical protein